MAAILDFRSERFELFLIFKLPFLPSLLLVQEKKRQADFQDGGQLGFPIGTILAIFHLQIVPILPTKFRVSWPFGSEEEAQNRFSKWQLWRPS